MRILARAPLAIALIFSVATPPGCGRRSDPQTTFEHLRQTLAHGNLAAANDEAENGYKKFHSVSPEWAWKFDFVRATVFYEQGKYERVLELLASEPAALPTGDPSVRKRWLEGLAYTSLGNLNEAERKFADAEGLCAGSDSDACASPGLL
jgi:hypothetical protein